MTVNMQKSLHGNMAFVDKNERLFGRKGLGVGGEGKAARIIGGPDTVAIFDDFYGNNISGIGGVDTGKAAPSATATSLGFLDTGIAGDHFITKCGAGDAATFSYVAGNNGVFRITGGSPATRTVAASGVTLVQRGLYWQATQSMNGQDSEIRFGCRFRTSNVTTGEHGFFVGFTDVASAEIPVHDTGGTADKGTATNAVGIGWNLGGDTGFMCYAVDGDTVQETPLTTTAPSANTWYEFEVVVTRGLNDTGGTAHFYLNGGSGIGGDSGSAYISKPLNVSTPLTPVVASYDTGGAATRDIDWIAVSGSRDTGT